jgi:hypothetical protein
MVKKFFVVCSLLMVFVLAACAAQPTLVILPPVDSTSVSSTQPAAANANAGSGNNNPNTVDNRLAYGILKLEGTSNAVTATQAKQLLPFWQQIQTLMSSAGTAGNNSGSNSTTAGDLQTVYQQIQQVLTTEQVTAIEQDNMTQADIQALMQQYNIQITPGAVPNGGNFPTLSPEERATRVAQFQQTPGAGGGRGFGGNGTPRANGTPGANGNRSFRGGMNFIFLNAVINLLQQRAGA